MDLILRIDPFHGKAVSSPEAAGYEPQIDLILG
jgi:hypothetical protein